VDHAITLGLGLPGQGLHLGIDALSLFFLAILVPQIAAAAIAGMHASATFWVFAAGMVLTVIAADAFTLILGFELMSAASWLLVLRGDRNVATLYVGIGLFSGACLIPAVFLPAGGVAFMLVVLGAGAKAGLAPVHAWLPRAHPAPPAGVSAVMSGGMVKVALYVIARYGFIVFGGAASPWWGVVLIIAGAAGVFIGALRAMLEVELKTLLACSTVGDPVLAALALQAALLCVAGHALFKPLLFLGAGAVKQATGTTSLDWLGGLMRGMPRLGALMLIGAAGMAALPLGPGFAPEFLLLHAVIAAAATGGILARIGFAALLTLLGLGAALSLGAAVRLIGIGFLGRPRSLRAAAAEEAPRPVLIGMGLLALCAVPVALLPGLILLGLQPVIAMLVPGLPLGYQPLPIVLLLLLAAISVWAVLQKFGARGEREVPAWTGGFGAPPVWLPFGDPKTQPTATGFAEPVQRAIAGAIGIRAGADPGETWLFTPLFRLHLRLTRLAERIRRATIRQRLAFVFAALVTFLLVLGLGQNG
jgi:formate hydrogenlyase subunit 3/multisubunit Na+/H+ antiporter MnhD subunit